MNEDPLLNLTDEQRQEVMTRMSKELDQAINDVLTGRPPEAKALAELDNTEAEELAQAPRGTAGIVVRSKINAKYQRERNKLAGIPEQSPEMAALEADRARRRGEGEPDSDDLRGSYERELKQIQRGDWMGVTALQEKYRKLGLNV